jgi:hypothetical protein
MVWRTGLSGVPPDSVRCTTGQCPVHQGTSARTLHLRENQRALRYNSPDSVRCTLDCPVCQRSNSYFTSNGRLQRIKCAPARAEDRAVPEGTPDSLQDLSGAPPDSPEAPQVRAPTVELQRSADVAGAPDSVRWRTGLSGAPCDSTLPTTIFGGWGYKYTNHPTFNGIQVFYTSTPYKSYSIQYKTHQRDQILSQTPHKALVIRESDLLCSFELLHLDCFFCFSFFLRSTQL